ncbi:hypothetical protein ACFS5M_14205 [Lacinutrix iliipiscaria]|uniref:Uncharacterized protein n=1 Tax=Lacinutrix iliipiscaria TaxID=1230532 RepID=A0ABW5WU56_9FLAO
MNHKWNNNKCTICGCEREKTFYGYNYYRSGQIFGINKRPDCIDWELENKKTID